MQNPITGLFNAVSSIFWPNHKPCHSFLAKLAQSGRPTRELIAEVIGLAVGSSVNYAQAVAQVVDFYLDPARAADLVEIKKLIPKTDPTSAELLRGYVREAQSMSVAYLDERLTNGATFQG